MRPISARFNAAQSLASRLSRSAKIQPGIKPIERSTPPNEDFPTVAAYSLAPQRFGIANAILRGFCLTAKQSTGSHANRARSRRVERSKNDALTLHRRVLTARRIGSRHLWMPPRALRQNEYAQDDEARNHR
jgi:hypothetical protein